MAVKNKKIQYHSFMANQDKSTLTLAFSAQKDKKQLISFQKVKNKSSWQKTVIFAVLSTVGLTFPFKAMASSETVTASIPIPVELVSEAQSSVELKNIPSSITIEIGRAHV